MKILLTVLALLLLGATARAQTVSPVPAPTMITTAPYTINSPGYYQLGADLTVSNLSGNIITINVSNVTLDFAGHYISGSNNPSSQLNGVYANEQGNLNIQNGTVAFCATGIYLMGNGSSTTLNINQRIQNMLVSYCFQVGINLDLARNSDVLNNRISFIGSSSQAITVGILYASDNAGEVGSISGNEVNTVTAKATGNYGIFCLDCFATNNKISNCTTGIYGGKYQNNLTFNCTTNVTQGTDAGGNN